MDNGISRVTIDIYGKNSGNWWIHAVLLTHGMFWKRLLAQFALKQ